jgi:hypothetical protein
MLNLPYEATPVDTVDSPTPTQFRDLVDAAVAPFVVAGLMNRWELSSALIKLTDPLEKCDYLGRTAAQTVKYTVLPPEQQGTLGLNDKQQPNFSFGSGVSTFPEFMNEVKTYITTPAKGNLYLQSTPIDEFNPKLGKLDMFEGFAPLTQPRFWIGTGAQFVALHNDPFRNIVAVFAGRKRVMLFPPEALPYLYMAPFDRRIGTVLASMVDVFKPDFEKFPLLEKALEMARVAIVNPGEFLYMPPFWWHAVEGEGFNVGLNCWFYDDNKANLLAQHLYVPAHDLVADLHQAGVDDARRAQLHTGFMQAIASAPSGAEASDPLERKVAQEAGRIRRLLHSVPVTAPQRDVWAGWVQMFTAHYIFRVHGNPYPSIGEDEFARMLERIAEDSKPKKHSLFKRIKMALGRLRGRFRARLPAEQHAFVPAAPGA